MAVEVERKFLVTSDDWRHAASGSNLRQGYIDTSDETTVRVRIADEAAFLTIKGPGAGMSRAEYEYAIPLNDAQEMLRDLCRRPLIEKVRHDVPFGGKVWSVDVFGAENDGLVLAEVELNHPEEDIPLPPWVGAEVTEDPRYRNSALALTPAPKAL
ncbi:CYTH domain-containing protein [Xanthobacteraceae bacterium A53D]